MTVFHRVLKGFGGGVLLVAGLFIAAKLFMLKMATSALGAALLQQLARVSVLQGLIFLPTGLPDDVFTVGPLILYLGWEGYLVVAAVSLLLVLAGAFILLETVGWLGLRKTFPF